jgi:NAD(P)-dependent dehydrogenase (short-subunit alcohol dehydrogenase family)
VTDRLQGRAAIVTGAAQGIGAAYAKALAAEGARLCVADIIDGEQTVDTIVAAGGQAYFQRTDVSDRESVLAMAQSAVDTFRRVDILVNNAALYAALDLKPFTEIDVDEWDKVMAVNVRGAFLCAQAVLPAMREQQYGRIINIASGTPYKGTPYMLHYVTSKGAILAMTRAISREVGQDGIRVNTLSPGLVLSEGVIANEAMREALTGPVLASRAIKREQTPDDLIEPLLFLVSEGSDFITGQSLVVDGGSVNN